MTRSLYLYAKYLIHITFNRNLHYVTSDLSGYMKGNGYFKDIPTHDKNKREDALHKVIGWLSLAQEKMNDMGFGSFHIAIGWGTSYPETTGYIIPTLLKYAEKYNENNAKQKAMDAALFLTEIQKGSGGWQGGRIGENQPEIVFNTGQAIRGMNHAYKISKETRFLDASVRACEWLCKIQAPDGFWKEHALLDQERVYDAFVDIPLLQLHQITGERKYRDAAVKNLHWVVGKQMLENGWFQNCDNTIKHNDKPILHTIAYTLDGLIEADDYLGEGTFREAARLGADELKNQLLSLGRLYGRYDKDWKGSEQFLCTGAAQMAIVWMRMYRYTRDRSYIEASDKIIDILIHIQQRRFKERPDSVGAVPGSFPIWGRYEPFAFPNWAAKFFADALMLRAEINE